jgi:hypothetical protein
LIEPSRSSSDSTSARCSSARRNHGHALGRRVVAHGLAARVGLGRRGGELGVVDLVAALAVLLGRVHRDVGVAQQVLDEHVLALADRQPDARQHLELLAGDVEALAHRGHEPVGDLDGLAALGDALDEDAELVAARRAAVSPVRRQPRRRCATLTSSSSPAAWPSVSLTALKSSRSRMQTATRWPSRAPRCSACSMRS